MTAPPALPLAIRQWRDRAVGWIRTDDPDGAAALAATRPPTGLPRVVVVGETNRGKSSLVNAVLGMPGLSPVDAGLATCTYLQFSHGESDTAVARFGRGMADISFPLRDLPTWATMAGDPAGGPDHDLPPPRWIEVTVPSPALRSVVLVDTPGVGGLVPGHADLAAEAAAGATALLFVVDASAPFTRGEIGFLQRVADRVDTVHFAVTKTDAFRGWREIVDADRQALARHVPRFAEAPFHPVSSTLAAAADGQSDPRIAEVIRQQSGLGQLREVLTTEVAARASLLADANLIRSTVTVIGGALVRLETERRRLTSGAEQVEHLRRRKEELLERRKSGGRSWQVILRAQIQRARVDLTHETSREVREAATLFRGAIDAADADQLRQLPFHIDAYAQSMTARAHQRLQQAMSQVVGSVLADLFTPQELAQLAGSLATRPYAPLVTRGPDRQKNADDTIMSLAGGGIGLTLGSLVRMGAGAVLPAAFGVVLLPVSLALGGAAAFFMVRSRRRVQDKQHLKQWLMEVLSEAKAQIDQNIAEQFIDADQQLTLALDDALTKQVSALDAEIREVDGALKLDATERARRTRLLVERGGQGAELMAAGEALIGRVQHTSAVGPPPGRAAADAAVRALVADVPAALVPPAAPAGSPVTADADVTGPAPGVRPVADPDVTDRATLTPRRETPATPPRAPFPTAAAPRPPLLPQGTVLGRWIGSRPDGTGAGPAAPPSAAGTTDPSGDGVPRPQPDRTPAADGTGDDRTEGSAPGPVWRPPA